MYQNLYTRFKQSPLAIISLIVSLSNWQLVVGLKATQWDMINFWLPWRHYIAQCYTNGIVPLWNPYSQAGYPIHGDLQGPAYSLEAIITSFISPINIYFLNYLYIFYLIVGAYGFYKLVLFFIETLPQTNPIDSTIQNKIPVAAIAGITFALCGYNSWHGHYLYITISVCLLPWIYYLFFKILNKGTWVDAIKLALMIWWQITAGNPSFIIVSFYFLVFAFICRFIYNLRKKLKTENKKMLVNIAIAGICAAVLAAPVFLNAYYVFPETSRAGGISAEWAAEESILWRNIFSVFSSITCNEREIRIGAEAPIYGLYMGIPTLLFAWFGIVKMRSFWIRVFSVIAIVAFFLSLGLQTPLFRVFHTYLPFFNVFRMPNLIIIYTLMYIGIMSALGFLYILKNKILIKQYLIFSGFTLLVLTLGVLYFAYEYPERETNYVTDYSNVHSFLWSASQAQKIFVSLILTTLTLATGFILIRKHKFKALALVLLLDVGINYNLGAIARIFSVPSAAYSNSFLQGLPQGFGPVDNIQDNKAGCLTNRMNALWLNASMFIEQPVHMNDNNFELTNYMRLYNDSKDELDYFTQQTQAFLADSLVKHSDFKTDTLQVKTIATVTDSSYTIYKNKVLQKSVDDTIICKQFFPHQIIYIVKNKKALAFVLQQNYTKLWKIKVNGKEVKPELSFYSFPLVFLNAGENKIEFVYEAPYFDMLFFTSVIGGCLLILVVILFSVPQRRKRLLLSAGFMLLCGYCCISFYTGGDNLQKSTLSYELRTQESLFNQYPNNPVLINTKDAFLHLTYKNSSSYNLLFNEDIASFIQQLRDTKTEYITYVCYKSLHAVETEALINLYYGEMITEQKINYGCLRIYKKNPQTALCFWSKETDFNADQSAWTIKDSVSGNTKVKLTTGNEYGGGTNFIMRDVTAKPRDMIYAECELEATAPEIPGMCFSIDRAGINKAFITYGMVHKRGNKKTALIYRFPEWVKDDDKITVFFWNNTKKTAIIDNMKVKLIRMD